MRKPAVWLYIVLAVGTVLWGVCLYQVLFVPPADTDVYVGTTVTYPSAYKGNASFPTCSVPRSGLSHPTVAIPAPKVTMQSVSQQGSSATWFVPTVSSQKMQHIGGGGNAPMGSTAQSNNSARGIAYANIHVSMPAVQGITTSASAVRGGSTSSDTYARMYQRESAQTATSASVTRRGALPPGVCEECHWVQDEFGHWYCEVCGADALDGCEGHENGYCWCPITDGWQVWLFLTVLAGTYAVYKKRKSIA